ncbi:hypothetical protein N0B31_12400 [Salinirubellus salinus]|uniref:Antibiotic biosynthesis monooxygenase n=1 Tax=Salinirubellus salinus TaxID=1364945 RepID=A0A9E7QZL0_9EURY|nr:hypothetical protein [Salinirubellus salinus]UWM52949.1 hypothetical protein N0B31_12400 [Salinirubellus salinus]
MVAARTTPVLVSVHHYELTDSTTDEAFREAVGEAETRDLFDLPGLVEYRFLHGVKGAREGRYAAQWVYESREAWVELWGPADAPLPPSEYPQRWRVWEDELLGPLLVGEADDIEFTTYEVVDAGREE